MRNINKFTLCYSIMFILNSFFLYAQTEQSNIYFGQKPPGLIPELFAPGIISTDDMENNIFFSADGKEIYIERTGTGKSLIYLYKLTDTGWQKPVQVMFIDDGGYNQPTFNYQSNVLITGRAIMKENQPPKVELSMRKKDGDKWTSSVYIAQGIRGSISSGGNIYATVIDFSKGFFGKIVRYVKDGDNYKGPEYLSENINTPEFSNDHSIISPDENTLIYSRKGNKGNAQLFISFRDKEGHWMPTQNLSAVLKSPKTGNEWLASFSPDGKYLFYNINGDIYWVDIKIIDMLKNEKSQ